MNTRIGYENSKGRPVMSLPIVSLNQTLFLSGLAFFAGVFLTYGILQSLAQ